MNDPRITPDPAKVTQNAPRQITIAVCDLYRAPDGPRDRQLLYGQGVTLLNDQNGWAYVQAERDGYVGYIRTDALGVAEQATHLVSAPCTHAYEAPDLKSRNLLALSHLSRVTALSETKAHIETSQGFFPKQHLSPITETTRDPATIAAHYLGTDYLWGGNTRWGIDCSGLVQAALLACGVPCPGDSDQQQALGNAASGPFQRNDLLFWKGHVALVCDPDTMIHANAHAMAVTYEPIEAAINRINTSDGGPLTAHRRL